MNARRDLLRLLSLGLASTLLPASNSRAAESLGQFMKSSFHFLGNASSTGWMNFEMPDDRYIVLPVMLNDERAEVLLDSGVGSIALDLSLAAKLRLRPKGSFAGVGVTGLAAGTQTEGLTILIGNVAITTSEATVIDLSPLNVATNRPVVAILGRDVFDPLVVDIDFESRRIAFLDPKISVALAGATRLPLIQGTLGRREISFSVEGQPPIPAIFDLGSDTPLYLSPDYVERLQLFRGKKTSTSLSVGVEGIEENQVAQINTIEIGRTSLHNIPVEVPRKWVQDVPAVMGVPILSRFRLLVDFGHDLIWMVPNQDVATKPFRKDRLGFAAMPATDCLRIVHISPGSPAAVAGLKVGDEIVAVDGQNVDAQYLKSRPRQGIRPAGTIIRYSLRSGSNVTLTLADYF